jgi:hypothetical protein
VGEDCAAVGAASAGYGADHARGARAELIGTWAALRGLAIVAVITIAGLFFFFVLLGIAVAAMAVLSIHKRLRPSVLTDYHYIHVSNELHTIVVNEKPALRCSGQAGLRGLRRALQVIRTPPGLEFNRINPIDRIATLDRPALSSPEVTLKEYRRSSRRWDIYVFSPLGVRSQARLRETV